MINKKFQLKFSFYVCSWLFALSLIYPLIIFNLFEMLLKVVGHDPHSAAAIALHGTRQEVMVLLVLLQLLFLGITFLISIFVSHRIAGPLYKLRKYFSEVREGNFSQTLFFRKADHFQEVATDYNLMMDAVRARCVVAQEAVDQAATALAAKDLAAIEAAQQKLKELQSAKPIQKS